MGSAHSGVLSPCVSPASGSAAVSAAHPPPPGSDELRFPSPCNCTWPGGSPVSLSSGRLERIGSRFSGGDRH
ncbi:hypothetical protein PR001_g8828 [Phytophthora rubi]|uniref:Uncharacterized protein n=1 Tax=Phytophthora rubi TaxID=129364 RepID=A0A6A3N7V7_9STRA|nr:hypothetical protein PR001_g8828 [Phytophthora rubi]